MKEKYRCARRLTCTGSKVEVEIRALTNGYNESWVSDVCRNASGRTSHCWSITPETQKALPKHCSLWNNEETELGKGRENWRKAALETNRYYNKKTVDTGNHTAYRLQKRNIIVKLTSIVLLFQLFRCTNEHIMPIHHRYQFLAPTQALLLG